jgi:hypothetical protein
MSQAFVKESDEQWLHEVQPTVAALSIHLSRENNGIRVYEKRTYAGRQGEEIHEMSNGFSYTKDKEGRWMILF